MSSKDKEDCEKKHKLDKLFNESHDELYRRGTCNYPECPMAVLTNIDSRTKLIHDFSSQNNKILIAHTDILNSIAETQLKHMSNISDNTKNIADHLKEFGDENKKLVSIIAGKKQVPFSIFFLTLLLFGVGALIMAIAHSKLDLIVDGLDHIKITQQGQK